MRAQLLHLALGIVVTGMGPLALAQVSSAPCWESNLGTNLGLGDDTVASQSLGFAFPGPAGPVTQIDISSNGFVWLASNTNSGCCSGSTSGFLSDLPRIALLWTDLNPTAGGAVYFNSITTGLVSRAVITWDQVPEFGSSAVVTMQLQLLADGAITMTYQAGATITNHTALVGVTEGNGATANPVDFSGLLGAPHVSGTNPTTHEEFASGAFDLAANSIEFIPNGGGYLVFERSGCGFARFSTFGSGCPDEPESYYEDFPPATFDLAGVPPGSTGLQVFPTMQNTYAVLPGSGVWFTPGTNTLTMGDDTVVQQPLPFPFPYQGGITNDIWICSNGYIWLQSSTSADFTPSPAELVSQGPRLCPMWADLNPSPTSSTGAGAIHYDVDPSGAAVYVTWNGVGEYGVAGASNTFQVLLTQSGGYEYRYQVAGAQGTGHNSITGWSPGGGVRDPGGTDLSVSLPIVTGFGSVPLTLSAAMGSRPVLGSPFSLSLTNIPANSPLGFLAFGFQRMTPALELTQLGMPGCWQLIALDAGITFSATGTSTTITLAVPNDPSLGGFSAHVQAAAIAPTVNPLGIVSSNGGTMVLGF